MKRISLLAACVFICAALAARAQTVAVVDLEQLVRLHPNTAADDKLREQTRKDMREEYDELQQKLEALKLDFEKTRKETQDPTLSDKARKTAEERAEKAYEAVLTANRNANEKMQLRQEQISEMNGRLLKKVIADLRDTIGKYAAEQKIQLVLPAAQAIYNEKALDITDAILKRMNVTRPAEKTAAVDAFPLIRAQAPEAPAAAKPATLAPTK